MRRLKQALSRDFCFTEWIASRPLAGRLQQLLGPNVVMPLAHHNCIMTKAAAAQQRHRLASGHPLLVVRATRPGQRVAGAHAGERPQRLSLPDSRNASPAARSASRYDEASFLRPDLPENQALIERAVRAELEPGDGLFFHARTFHAASRNHSEATKMSVVFTFRAADNRPLPQFALVIAARIACCRAHAALSP